MNRFKELRKQNGYSQQELADLIFVNQTAVSQWELDKSYPSVETLKKLSELYNVPTDYLLGVTDVDIRSSSNGVWIPVLGKIQAGIPVEAIEDILDYEEITKEEAQQGEYFALQIKGKSMEPKFSEGDVIIVRKQEDVDTGDIAVVLVNGDDATVKRIKKRPEGIILIPNNPAYEPMFYSSEEVENLPVTIIGKVVELRAKF